MELGNIRALHDRKLAQGLGTCRVGVWAFKRSGSRESRADVAVWDLFAYNSHLDPGT